MESNVKVWYLPRSPVPNCIIGCSWTEPDLLKADTAALYSLYIFVWKQSNVLRWGPSWIFLQDKEAWNWGTLDFGNTAPSLATSSLCFHRGYPWLPTHKIPSLLASRLSWALQPPGVCRFCCLTPHKCLSAAVRGGKVVTSSLQGECSS